MPPDDRRTQKAFILLCEAMQCLSSASINLGRYGVTRGKQYKGDERKPLDFIEYQILSEKSVIQSWG